MVRRDPVAGVGFWPGTDLAVRYNHPEKLRRFRRVHVRITWRDSAGKPLAMPGPIYLGGGRLHGLGLFAGWWTADCSSSLSTGPWRASPYLSRAPSHWAARSILV